jgi:hypothetical protein
VKVNLFACLNKTRERPWAESNALHWRSAINYHLPGSVTSGTSTRIESQRTIAVPARSVTANCYYFLYVWRLMAGHGSRAVWGMNCLRLLGRCDSGFESHLGHECLVCVFVVLYLGRGFTTDRSLVQGVLPIVYRSKEKWKPRYRESTVIKFNDIKVV